MEYGRGNPPLLEWLEQIAGNEEMYDLEALKESLRGKTEEFINEYLADVIAKTVGEDFHQFLHKADVFRQPVEGTAYDSFGSRKLLEKGVNLTLFERKDVPNRESLYWVTPVTWDSQWGKLSEEEKKKMHRIAYTWYGEKIKTNQIANYRYWAEAVHHTLGLGNIRGACKHAIVLGEYLEDN